MKNKQNNKRKIFTTIALAVLLLTAVLLAIYHFTDIFKSPNAPNQIVGIDYSPGTPEQNEAINRAKESKDFGKDTVAPTSTPSNIQINLIASDQDSAGGPIFIKALLQNVVDGLCKVTIKQDTTVVEETSNIIRQNNYYTCGGFSIDSKKLQTGNAQLVLTVIATNGASKDVDKIITIK